MLNNKTHICGGSTELALADLAVKWRWFIHTTARETEREIKPSPTSLGVGGPEVGQKDKQNDREQGKEREGERQRARERERDRENEGERESVSVSCIG